MFHDSRELGTILSTRCAAVGAYFDIGVESAALSKKLLGNTQKMWLSAATHKDAKDVARATSAFVNASYRDIAENADAVARIWRRFICEALSGDFDFRRLFEQVPFGWNRFRPRSTSERVDTRAAR